MVYQWLHDTLVVRLDRGEEVVAGIEELARKLRSKWEPSQPLGRWTML